MEMMRRILLFIGCLMVLGAVVPGCNRVPRYDGRLTAADSLMRDDPDSALAVLEALCIVLKKVDLGSVNNKLIQLKGSRVIGSESLLFAKMEWGSMPHPF
jgi:hypothetical protein